MNKSNNQSNSKKEFKKILLLVFISISFACIALFLHFNQSNQNKIQLQDSEYYLISKVDHIEAFHPFRSDRISCEKFAAESHTVCQTGAQYKASKATNKNEH